MSTQSVRNKINTINGDFTSRQIAEALNMDIHTVSYILYRMRKRGEIHLIYKGGFKGQPGGLYAVYNKEFREIEPEQRALINIMVNDALDKFNRRLVLPYR